MVNFLWFSPRIYLKHAMSSHYRACSEDDERRERRLCVASKYNVDIGLSTGIINHLLKVILGLVPRI